MEHSVILFNFGQNHNYFNDCINQILKYNSVQIYFIGNTDIGNNQVNFINLKELEDDSKIREFKNISFYENDNNPLWRTSMMRFFYIEALIRKNNLKNIIHFDNDVMIYDSFNKIIQNIKETDQNVITPTNEFNLTCGMFYIRNLTSITELNSKLFEKLKLGIDGIYAKHPNRGSSLDPFMVNEMTILKIIQEENLNLLSLFPILPTSENYKEYNICFDPASWGQYIGGTFNGNPPGWAGEHHYIGREILKRKYKILFENKKPQILDIDTNEKYPLFNLHIHSKNLKTFLS
jgi:hypothetical protein